jgi:hypothetical protein
MQKFKNRPFWTAPSGLQCAACHVLAALSALQQRPHVPLFENCVYDIYIWWILKHMCWVAACEAESLVSKYMYICFDILVRIFWRAAAHVGDSGVVTCMTSLGVGGGILSSFLPTPRLGRACTCASFGLCARSVGGVQHADYIWCMGAWPPPPSIDWVGHARYHSPIQFSILIINSNLNVKSEFQSKLCHHVLDVGSGGMHCLDLA